MHFQRALIKTISILVALTLLSGCGGASQKEEPFTPVPFENTVSPEKERPVTDEVVSSEGIKGKVLAGYQGWFQSPKDGSGSNSWGHWVKNNTTLPNSLNRKFELYPDMREYEKKYFTGFKPLGSGEKASLFSSYDYETVDTHFKWMNQYGIDGVAQQRFMVQFEENAAHMDQVLKNVQKAAEKYGRVFYLEYDFTGNSDSNIVEKVKKDFLRITKKDMQLTSSDRYLKVDGKPVVELWGVGIAGSYEHSTQVTLDMIRWFKDQGCYVIGGVPGSWNAGNYGDGKAGFEKVYAAFDMLNPWNVGRYKSPAAAKKHNEKVLAEDVKLCHSRKQAYMPVIYSGHSWSNWYPGAENDKNGIPRKAGEFLWEQFKGAKENGCDTLFIAMFDEYDEGTAIAKAASDSSMIPNQDTYMLTLSADGTYLSSDYYLRLAGEIRSVFRGDKPLTDTVTIPHTEGPVFLNTSFERGFDVPAWNNPKLDKKENFEGQLVVKKEEQAHVRETAVCVDGKTSGAGSFEMSFLDKEHIQITKDMKLTFWRYAENEGGRRVTLEITATDGTKLSSTKAVSEAACLRKNTPYGKTGEWEKYGFDLGKYMAGKTIQTISLRYEGDKAEDVKAYVDDLMIFC